MPMYPQINASCILTQLPYTAGFSFDNPKIDLETGMRWSFARRGNLTLPSDYSPGAQSKYQLNYPSITDAEVAALYSFFQSMRGRWGTFGFLDPGGNLLQYSEDMTQSYWAKNAVTVGGSVADPFGGSRATSLTATSGNSYISAVIGPSGGGLQGYMLNASIWARATSSGQSITVGFLGSTGSSYYVSQYNLPQGSWVRIDCNVQYFDNFFARFILGGENLWSGSTIQVFGAQVTSMKGSGAYIRTAGAVGPGYAYRPNCRFETDVFQRTSLGPNQNQLALPISTFGALSSFGGTWQSLQDSGLTWAELLSNGVTWAS